ncbi:MAG: hypothetical protein WCI18_11935 [Pseudomonadota bacterium]
MNSILFYVFRSFVPSIVSVVLASVSYAGVDIGLDGSASNYDMGLQNNKRSMISGSVDVGLGNYFRLGFTHRVDTMTASGYKQDSASKLYYYEESRTDVASNSLNLSLILYYGDLFIPYIQAGAVVKDYYMIEKSGGVTYVINPEQSGPEPSAGAGLHIVLSKEFNLKLSYTVSPGVKIQSPSEPQKVTAVLDSTTAVGVVYKI